MCIEKCVCLHSELSWFYDSVFVISFLALIIIKIAVRLIRTKMANPVMLEVSAQFIELSVLKVCSIMVCKVKIEKREEIKLIQRSAISKG